MSGLFLSTMAMMGFTFLIGFVVAGVIWLIAFWAGRLEFYNTHREELLRARNIRAVCLRRKAGWGFFSPLRKGDTDYELGSYYQGHYIMPEDTAEKGKFYHETSLGASDLGLMDFYYPSDARIRILEQQQAAEEQESSAESPQRVYGGKKRSAAGETEPAGLPKQAGKGKPEKYILRIHDIWKVLTF